MFKVGDALHCINDAGSDGRLTIGYTYFVSAVDSVCDLIQLEGVVGNWSKLRFKPIKKAENSVKNANKQLTLPTDSAERKNYPLYRGLLKYFPAALAGIAQISKAGNDKHNPGEELHHARGKSSDHGDCIIRHLMDASDLLAAHERGAEGPKPEEILNEVNQLAWRALAFSQELHEKFGAPFAPGAKK